MGNSYILDNIYIEQNDMKDSIYMDINDILSNKNKENCDIFCMWYRFLCIHFCCYKLLLSLFYCDKKSNVDGYIFHSVLVYKQMSNKYFFFYMDYVFMYLEHRDHIKISWGYTSFWVKVLDINFLKQGL